MRGSERPLNSIETSIAAAILIVAIGGTMLLSALAAIEYLSDPPDKGEESRQYAECADIKAYQEGCKFIGTAGEDSSEEDTNQAHDKQYGPNPFIKDKRDINAQEGMWRATNFLSFLTLLQIFIGVAGVALIYRTLIATEDAVREASEATKLANATMEASIDRDSPFLFFDIEFKRKLFKSAPEEDFSICIRNYGGTHAIKISLTIFSQFCYRTDAPGESNFIPLIDESRITALASGKKYVIPLANNRPVEHSRLIGKDRRNYIIYCYGEYETVFDKGERKPFSRCILAEPLLRGRAVYSSGVAIPIDERLDTAAFNDVVNLSPVDCDDITEAGYHKRLEKYYADKYRQQAPLND